MKGSESAFDYVHFLHCICHKINLNHNGSYIGSPDWVKNRKATISLINKKDNKRFQYAATVWLNNEEIKNSQIMTKIKLFISKYNWEKIHFPSEKYDWKKIEKK